MKCMIPYEIIIFISLGDLRICMHCPALRGLPSSLPSLLVLSASFPNPFAFCIRFTHHKFVRSESVRHSDNLPCPCPCLCLCLCQLRVAAIDLSTPPVILFEPHVGPLLMGLLCSLQPSSPCLFQVISGFLLFP